MYHHDPKHTGLGTAFGPTAPTLKWVFTAQAEVQASPVIGPDGTIYIGADKLYALDSATGNVMWSFKDWSSRLISTPAVGSDGTIYFGDPDGELIALNADGTLKWKFQTPEGSFIESSPVISADGTIYIGDGRLYAINPDGTEKWRSIVLDCPIQEFNSPAIGDNGIVYVSTVMSSASCSLYAISLADGSVIWSFSSPGGFDSSPAIGPDGTIYIGSDDAKVFALDPTTGTVKWSYSTSDDVRTTPAIGPDGTIYVADDNGIVYAFTSNGVLKWSKSIIAGTNIRHSSPAVDPSGNIYWGTQGGNIFAINSNGDLLWTYSTLGSIDSSPAIGEDGTLYIGSFDMKLYAIK